MYLASSLIFTTYIITYIHGCIYHDTCFLQPIKMDHEKDTLLKVHLPGKQTTVITVPPRLASQIDRFIIIIIIFSQHNNGRTVIINSDEETSRPSIL